MHISLKLADRSPTSKLRTFWVLASLAFRKPPDNRHRNSPPRDGVLLLFTSILKLPSRQCELYSSPRRWVRPLERKIPKRRAMSLMIPIPMRINTARPAVPPPTILTRCCKHSHLQRKQLTHMVRMAFFLGFRTRSSPSCGVPRASLSIDDAAPARHTRRWHDHLKAVK